ncbi:unnamed protein product [Cunninghamella blakesleeana]
MSQYISYCYGDHGERLAQLFDITFGYIKHNHYTAEAILIQGPSGVGKSMVINLLSEEYNLKVLRITLGELALKYNGRIALGLERLVWESMKEYPCVVVLEDVDLFFPRYADAQDNGLILVLEDFFNYISLNPHRTLFIGTTRNDTHIDLSAKRLFQDSIKLDIPTPQERLVMMKYLASQSHFDLRNIDMYSLSSYAHGFMASNLAHWFKLAENMATQEATQIITEDYFKNTFTQINVIGQQGMMAEKPDSVKWTDIGGLMDAKKSLEESAVWIYKHADAYKRLGIRPSKGVLLYGPPGTGKTLLAKAVATESNANYLSISVPDLIKAEVGESEKALSTIFKTAIRCSPSVIFLDEIEAIFSSRDKSGDVGKKLISQFLIEMDHLDKVDQNVILLGATNHLESIDKSILCPGRLDRLIYIGPPSVNERLSILQVIGKSTQLSPSIDLRVIAEKTEGYTGADLKAMIRKAGLNTLKRSKYKENESLIIEYHDIEQALIPSLPFGK